ncbi:MAG TPA: hypothetical protein VM364_00865 [Vicinamibacterales bacterium]|nr:hypothetical protein [Vicinamibacterales bacterium]
MAMQVLQRPDWHGEPLDQGEYFRLVKGERTAVCRLFTHQFGWELRLETSGDVRRTQVCRSQEDVFDTAERWKAAALALGWTDPVASSSSS